MDDRQSNDQTAAAEPLDFDTWAALSAALLEIDEGQRLALLAEVGITPDHWTRSDHHHTRALVGDLAAGRTERPNAYAALCAAEKHRRRLAAPARTSPRP